MVDWCLKFHSLPMRRCDLSGISKRFGVFHVEGSGAERSIRLGELILVFVRVLRIA